MTQRVVDQLEAVQINEQKGQHDAVTVRQTHMLLQPLVQRNAIGQAGQRVARGRMLDLRFGDVAARHLHLQFQDTATQLNLAHHAASEGFQGLLLGFG